MRKFLVVVFVSLICVSGCFHDDVMKETIEEMECKGIAYGIVNVKKTADGQVEITFSSEWQRSFFNTQEDLQKQSFTWTILEDKGLRFFNGQNVYLIGKFKYKDVKKEVIIEQFSFSGKVFVKKSDQNRIESIKIENFDIVLNEKGLELQTFNEQVVWVSGNFDVKKDGKIEVTVNSIEDLNTIEALESLRKIDKKQDYEGVKK